jgi:hypothetical protein
MDQVRQGGVRRPVDGRAAPLDEAFWVLRLYAAQPEQHVVGIKPRETDQALLLKAG